MCGARQPAAANERTACGWVGGGSWCPGVASAMTASRAGRHSRHSSRQWELYRDSHHPAHPSGVRVAVK
eukprot:3106379-Pleurochrysis_carterae.AAC.1